MEFVVVCDSDGTVRAMISAPEGAPRPSFPQLPPGQREVSVQISDITDYTAEDDAHRRLDELLTGHRVDLIRKVFVAR